MENYSLSDLKAITDSDGFAGGGAGTLIILFLLILFMGGGNWNNRGLNDAQTNEILLGQKFDALGTKVNQIGDGISSLGYSQLQTMSQNTASINGNIVNEGRALQTQLANCCCENQKNIDSLRYDMTVQNNAITTAIHAEGEATRNMIQQNKIEALQQRISSLELNNAVAGVVRYPQGTTYCSGANPFCNCNSCA